MKRRLNPNSGATTRIFELTSARKLINSTGAIGASDPSTMDNGINEGFCGECGSCDSSIINVSVLL
jgi:hypothetical protein